MAQRSQTHWHTALNMRIWGRFSLLCITVYDRVALGGWAQPVRIFQLTLVQNGVKQARAKHLMSLPFFSHCLALLPTLFSCLVILLAVSSLLDFLRVQVRLSFPLACLSITHCQLVSSEVPGCTSFTHQPSLITIFPATTLCHLEVYIDAKSTVIRRVGVIMTL